MKKLSVNEAIELEYENFMDSLEILIKNESLPILLGVNKLVEDNFISQEVANIIYDLFSKNLSCIEDHIIDQAEKLGKNIFKIGLQVGSLERGSKIKEGVLK